MLDSVITGQSSSVGIFLFFVCLFWGFLFFVFKFHFISFKYSVRWLGIYIDYKTISLTAGQASVYFGI